MNAITQVDKITEPVKFTDKKRKLWLLGLVVPNIANATFLGYQFGPKITKKLFTYMGPLALHIIIPAIDKYMGEDPENPPEEAVTDLENDPYYARVVKLFIPLQIIANLYGNYLVSQKAVSLEERILFGHILGLVNGVAINTAHELSHKSGKLEHYLSHLCLAPTGYNHFRIEHPYGHHKRVATPEDPASSQMGESFYRFWPRTVFGGLKSAIQIEKKRLERKGLKFLSKENELFHGWAMSAGYHALMLSAYGKKLIPYTLTQAFYGVTLFEIVNYIEHYGLKRTEKDDGSYERTLPEHSWNNNNIVTNLFLYQLQRHSDHHAFPSRPFQALRHFDEAPELPSGYATMLIPALIPPLWYKMMDQRVYQHYQGDLTKANIHPGKREKIFKKFGLILSTEA